jgi:hypothetical protein
MLKMISLVEIITLLYGIQLLQMFVESYPTRYPICTRGSSFIKISSSCVEYPTSLCILLRSIGSAGTNSYLTMLLGQQIHSGVCKSLQEFD